MTSSDGPDSGALSEVRLNFDLPVDLVLTLERERELRENHESLGSADRTASRIMDYLFDEEIDKVTVRQARHLILNAEPYVSEERAKAQRYASEEWINEVVELLFVWGLLSEHVELGPLPLLQQLYYEQLRRGEVKVPEREWVSTHVDEPTKTITTTWRRRDGSTFTKSKQYERLERIA